ncbi:tyrosine-type recombinase/integrase [Herbiconiux sp. SYSU D00978]|uniref:tyrosine-type recombinase/integrase n=1 Tax=Herbiconiux sp. SYSU D00978 TaxID=2812562 RepID=UPI001A966415|nr:tyrosine-type recombinase/integrase [Herbiconiux sp. SYSU D00978]
MSTYQPEMPKRQWNQISAYVEAAVGACGGNTKYSDGELFKAASRLAAWAKKHDLALEHAVLFDAVTIERFVAEGLTQYAPASRGNRRSMLLRMSEVLLGEQARTRLVALPASSPSSPYTHEELKQLRLWARTKGHEKSDANVLLALGLGAGLSASEITAARAEDIHDDGGSVLIEVRGGRPRRVPVREEWTERLSEARKHREGDQFLFVPGRTGAGKNLITNWLARSSDKGLRPHSQRMRGTWIVTHLREGAPAIGLMKYAGVASLEALTRWVPAAEAA